MKKKTKPFSADNVLRLSDEINKFINSDARFEIVDIKFTTQNIGSGFNPHHWAILIYSITEAS